MRSIRLIVHLAKTGIFNSNFYLLLLTLTWKKIKTLNMQFQHFIKAVKYNANFRNKYKCQQININFRNKIYISTTKISILQRNIIFYLKE